MTPIEPEHLYAEPNALAPYYSRFRVSERLLLTGHSHQAWPDRGFEGQKRAWEDAARLVDEKWGEAFERAERVRAGYARLLGTPGSPDRGDYALGVNTHELVLRFLSAVPLLDRPRVVTTVGEFHSIRRQLDRLEEEGLEVVRVAVDPIDGLAERLIAATDDTVCATLVSAVLFRDARIVRGLGAVADRCAESGAELLVDTYHALDAIPFDLASQGLERAFVVGGGYKYCQLGEGNCFLRVPADCELRPAITGWFAEFSELAGPPEAGVVGYPMGEDRFAGSTYDPTSHYRAAEVFDFFDEMGLEPQLLRTVSRHQIGLLAARFDGLDLDPAVIRRDRDTPLEDIGGFLALSTPIADRLHAALKERGVSTDVRDDLLRFGPAPYLSDRQLEDAMEALAEAISATPSSGV